MEIEILKYVLWPSTIFFLAFPWDSPEGFWTVVLIAMAINVVWYALLGWGVWWLRRGGKSPNK